MSGAIFVLNDDGRLVKVSERSYDSEDLLQRLLADYPDLLAGDQMDSSNPRRWLLVRREAPLPDEEGGSGRWSLDHLFLDQDARPTLVEVKRSSDTRIRREVVGQMLDYAANAVAYWSSSDLRAYFDLTNQKKGLASEEVLTNFLDPEADPEQFWAKVKDNLETGKIRMVFVADVIPPELKRIVEFLNDQMSRAEVLAVEIRQYLGEGLKTLVPRVIGLTAAAEAKKNPTALSEKRQWNKELFLKELQQTHGDSHAHIIEKILTWADDLGLVTKWGNGAKIGTFTLYFMHNDVRHHTAYFRTSGIIEFYFAKMHKPPFDEVSMRIEFIKKLNQIDDLNLSEDKHSSYPVANLSILGENADLKKFLAAFEWYFEEIKKSNEDQGI